MTLYAIIVRQFRFSGILPTIVGPYGPHYNNQYIASKLARYIPPAAGLKDCFRVASGDNL